MKAAGHPYDTVTAASLRDEQAAGRIVVPIQTAIALADRIEAATRVIDEAIPKLNPGQGFSIPRRNSVKRWAEAHLNHVRRELTR